jgi:hypothetical protein
MKNQEKKLKKQLKESRKNVKMLKKLINESDKPMEFNRWYEVRMGDFDFIIFTGDERFLAISNDELHIVDESISVEDYLAEYSMYSYNLVGDDVVLYILSEIALRKGYKAGVKCIFGSEKGVRELKSNTFLIDDGVLVSLWEGELGDDGELLGDLIMNNGIWAEIVKSENDTNGVEKLIKDELTKVDAELERQERISILNEVKSNKQLRVNLDVELQRLKSLDNSRERSLAITKLQECIMWLGMDLKRLNEPNPYPDSYKPENSKIAPTADGMKM